MSIHVLFAFLTWLSNSVAGRKGWGNFQQGHKNLLSPLDGAVVGKSQRSQWEPAGRDKQNIEGSGRKA